MSLFLKAFSTHSEYEQYINGSGAILPNVSICITEGDVHYNPYVKPIETRLVAKFNVTDTSSPTQLCYSSAVSQFSEIEIDGVVQPNVVSAYTFSTLGEHTVKYTLIDPTNIGNSAFRNCTSLTSIDIPDSVTSIGYQAFYDCSSLTSVDIPSGITSINESAFANCSNLKSVIMEAITPPILGNSVFYNSKKIIIYVPTCSSVSAYKAANTWSDYRNVIISLDCPTLEATFNVTDTTDPTRIAYNTNIFALIEIDGIKMATRSGYTFSTTGDHTVKYYLNGTSIGGSAFYQCSSLTSIDIPDSVTSIGDNAFSQCSGLTRINSDVDGVFNIPDSVTSIGGFNGCKGLTSINIPSGVTSIGMSAFSGCSNLTSIDIPSGVTTIGSAAFRGCRSLTNIIIPNSITTIGSGAFYGCSSLTSITVEAATPPTLGGTAFDYTNNCPIYVLFDSVDTYKSTSGWSDYASRIQAKP